MAPDRQPRQRAPLPDRGYLGLSFSGGGYRATAFSLGTMALLQDLGLLGRARVMSSVSGGSLALGAYLCAKAGANLAEEADFLFYDRVWQPLMAAMATEDLARAFYTPPMPPSASSTPCWDRRPAWATRRSPTCCATVPFHPTTSSSTPPTSPPWTCSASASRGAARRNRRILSMY